MPVAHFLGHMSISVTRLLILAFISIWALPSLGQSSPLQEQDGYVDSIAEEREQNFVELIHVQKPPEEKQLKEVIFDSKISKELTKKYTDTFGITNYQRQADTPNRYTERVNSNGQIVTWEQHRDKEQEYGEFMTKRLAEHHIDLYFKEKEQLRTVYEVKEKLSNVKFEVRKDYSLKASYSLSAEDVTLRLINPYDIGNSLVLSDDESIIRVEYGFTKTIRGVTQYRVNEGLFLLAGTKQLTESLSTTLEGTTDFIPVAGTDGESRIFWSFAWR